MKTIKLFKLIALTIVTITVASCVDGNEYDVPPVAQQLEPNIIVNSSITAAKEAWNQNFSSNNEAIYTFDNNIDLYLEGYVVSSDYAGNFYKSLIIQDAPENPTAGIEILINKTSLFETFEIGRKVYVKLDGLSVEYDDGGRNIDPTNSTPGRYRIGYLASGRVDDIPSFMLTDHVLRSSTVATIVPMIVTISDFSQDNINTMIQLENMQFPLNELGKTFAGETSDSFDGMRIMVSCDDDSSATLQTSTFSDFKSNTLPEGKGTAAAVLAKDYRADNFVLIISSPTDLDFSSTDRCDPVILDCGNGTVGGATVLFDEDFEGTSEAQLTTDGWLNVNVNGGSTDFSLRSFSGNSYMQTGAFRSGEDPMEVWLISPAINLDASTDEELTFETKVGYHNGDALSVFVSTDFTGDIDTATWALVNADLANSPSNGYGTTYTQSGSINMSCLDGDVYVAFRYLGADGGITTTFQIDNVKVTGN